MNAFVMAAGNGSRLSPVTDDTPKCLLQIGGKPMLAWWLDTIFSSKCFSTVHVNLHHLADRVEIWLGEYEEACGNEERAVKRIDERQRLLGTAGTLYWYGEPAEDLMVAYPDTISFDIFEKLPLYVEEWKYLREKQKDLIAAILTFDAPEDLSSSTLATDREGWVTKFIEKGIAGSQAWAGVLFGSQEMYDHIQPFDNDLAKDVLPRLVGKMKAIGHVDAYDIGRGVEHYERAKQKYAIYEAGRR